jgi:hypothetical protein
MDYNDTNKTLKGPQDGSVNITRSSGTNITGTKFSANVRSRTFEFDGPSSGTWVQKDDEKKNK